MTNTKTLISKTTFYWIFLSICILVGSIYLLSWIIVMNGFHSLERKFVLKNIASSREVVANRLKQSLVEVSDWSIWDDCYSFIEDRNEAFIKSNLQDMSLETLDLDAMIFFNSKGELVFSKHTDFVGDDGNNTFQIPTGLEEHLTPDSSFLKNVDEKGSAAGIVVLSSGSILMVVSKPILKSDGTGPIRGTVVFARKFDEHEMGRLGKIIKAKMEIQNVDSPTLPQDFHEAKLAFQSSDEPFIKKVDNNFIAGFSVLKDTSGKHNLILKVSIPKEISNFGNSALQYFFVALIFVGSFFGLSVYLPLEREISQRLGVEKQLTELKNRFEQVTEHSKEIIWEVDVTGLYTYISQSVKDSLGYEQSEVIGKKYFYDLHPEEGREEFMEKAFQIFARKDLFRNFENRAEAKNGQTVWLITSGLPVLDENSNLLGYRGNDYDITQRKEAEELLEKSKASLNWQNALFTALLKNIPVGVHMVEVPSGKSLVANEKAIALLGPGIHGNLFSGSISEEYKLCKLEGNELYPREELPIVQAIRGEKSSINDLVVKYPNGTKRRLEVFGSPVTDDRGKILAALSTYIDITDQKNTEAMLLDAKECAEAATIAKTQFLANMSHEIRTPMNAILGFSTLLAKTDLTEKQIDYVKTVQSSGQLLMEVINDILDVAKFESKGFVLECIEFDLVTICNEVLKMCLPGVKNKSIETYIKIHQDVPTTLKGDPTRLKQVLINLLGNAVKFTSDGSIGLEVFYGQREHDDGMVSLRFHVKDTGIGIPRSKCEEIFRPFTQVDESTTRKYGGTGLGLSICQAIVSAFDGKIWVESEIGKGSNFIFTARFKTVAIATSPQTTDVLSQSQSDKSNQKKLRILLVEDDFSCQKLVMEYMRILDYACDLATNGQEAIDMMRAQKYDLCLMDVQMPIMDGLMATEKIRKEISKEIPIIALSAAVMNEDRLKGNIAGMNGYLTKPVELDELQECILKCLNIKHKS